MRDLFIMPRGHIESEIISESTKYNNNKSFYPYTRYINWTPDNAGNILTNDKKFLNILYSLHGSKFEDKSKILDATDETKTDIYEFIGTSHLVELAVDCENADPYKLAACLQRLNSDEINKVRKIVLYDDVNTTKAWKFFEGVTEIPIEHILVKRINKNKSLVDIKMGMGISEAFYKNGVDSFILLSSDSDFWGVISSLPDARFLVMVEDRKCGDDIIDALEENETEYCYIDDFCTGNISDFKKGVLMSELKGLVDDVINLNANKLLDDIYLRARIEASDTEKKNFYDKYIKKISLTIDNNGNFKLIIPG